MASTLFATGEGITIAVPNYGFTVGEVVLGSQISNAKLDEVNQTTNLSNSEISFTRSRTEVKIDIGEKTYIYNTGDV